MRSGGRLALSLLLVCMGGIGAAYAQQKPTEQDRAAIAQCLAKAKTTKAAPESCISAVQGPCLDKPEGQSTVGMRDCANREAAIWDEQLNKGYKAVLKEYGDADADGDSGKKLKGADLIRDAERAWLASREKKCRVAGLQMAGGSGAGVLIDDCYLYETAHQAIWLNSLVDTP
ncbi:uncharacterized protein YecT (DUF1311 family) [Methylovirgula ligni]|uniref:Uncharacterized protein YecT (DUF1311 family) n=1 Tax=Methylovirgula ligni TaxID=569860 RepID=A0A3D9YUZ7_9HYPH|nr:lysozyme inhibitor LprI family protein [Methylovirgula ligni]REF86314.1 uncharacterized protein YecT (DUF1311 family) [Methylovirgula ligni]